MFRLANVGFLRGFSACCSKSSRSQHPRHLLMPAEMFGQVVICLKLFFPPAAEAARTPMVDQEACAEVTAPPPSPYMARCQRCNPAMTTTMLQPQRKMGPVKRRKKKRVGNITVVMFGEEGNQGGLRQGGFFFLV